LLFFAALLSAHSNSLSLTLSAFALNLQLFFALQIFAYSSAPLFAKSALLTLFLLILTALLYKHFYFAN